MPSSILLIAPEAAADAVADTLQRELGTEVEVAANRRSGMAALRRREYGLVVLEESLTAGDAEAAELLYRAAGAAPLLEVNFALAGPARLVRQARATLARRAHDRTQARAAAVRALHGDLNATLSGLLLEAELALRIAPPELESKLRTIVGLTVSLRDHLRS